MGRTWHEGKLVYLHASCSLLPVSDQFVAAFCDPVGMIIRAVIAEIIAFRDWDSLIVMGQCLSVKCDSGCIGSGIQRSGLQNEVGTRFGESGSQYLFCRTCCGNGLLPRMQQADGGLAVFAGCGLPGHCLAQCLCLGLAGNQQGGECKQQEVPFHDVYLLCGGPEWGQFLYRRGLEKA